MGLTKAEAIAKAQALKQELESKGVHAYVVVDPDGDEAPGAGGGAGEAGTVGLPDVSAEIAHLAGHAPDPADLPAVAKWLDAWDGPAQAVALLYQQQQVSPELHAAWAKGKEAVAGALASVPQPKLLVLALHKGLPHPGTLTKHLGITKSAQALAFLLNPFYRQAKKAPLEAKMQELFAALPPQKQQALVAAEAGALVELDAALAALESPGKVVAPSLAAAPQATPAGEPAPVPAWDAPSPVPSLTHRDRVHALEGILLQRRAVGYLPDWLGADAIRATRFEHVRQAGDLGGVHAKHVYREPSGREWLFKPDKHGGAVAHAEAAAAAVSRRAGLPTLETAVVELDGKVGSVQPLIAGARPLPGDPREWSPIQVHAILACHVVDWLLGDHDGNPPNFLLVGSDADADRVPVRVDRGQAFKFFGEDRLALDYEPNAKHGAKPHAAILAYRAAREGRIRLDPYALYPVIRSAQSIPDEEYIGLLRPLAEAGARSSDRDCAWRARVARAAEERLGRKPDAAEIAEAFLAMAVERKRSLKRDFERLIGEVIGAPFSFGS